MKGSGPIIIIGFKGCGKTTIGRMLAARLGRMFMDTDDMIEDLHKERMKQDLDFRGIYTEHGQEYFETLETEAVRAALKKRDCVISFGGGALAKADSGVTDSGVTDSGVTDSGVTDSTDTVFVYITVDPDVLFERIMKNGVPAFFKKDDPRSSFNTFMDQRAPVYEKYATFTVDNTKDNPEVAVNEIIETLKTQGRPV